MPLLEVRGLTKYFGGLAAISDLDLDVNRGEIVGLIGPNGAGKTTFFNIVTGVYRPTRGKVYFKGRDITGLSTHTIAKMGLLRTFQLTTLFKEKTTTENVLVGHFLQDRAGYWSTFWGTPSAKKSEKDSLERSMEVLEYAGLAQLKDKLAKNLSHGYQKTLGICIALAASPELLLLDEPVTALSPERVAHIMDLIRRVREQGTTILIIEHNMRAICDICDRIIVLNAGRNIAEGAPHEIRENKEVIVAYLGGGRFAA